MDIFAENVDPTRDLPKDRVINVTDGSPFHIRQEDPYGFWSISREQGQIPESLSGSWTSFEKANHAVRLYINNHLEKK